jgi:sec-independent protein translocase protein TatA
MLSIPEMAVLGGIALLLFGPDQLPRVARKAGSVMRDIQNTSQSFLREMERAADVHEPPRPAPPPPPPPAATERSAETGPGDPYDEPAVAPVVRGIDPYDETGPAPVAEKLGEPRPALDLETPSGPAEPVPHPEHPTHV